MLMNIVQNVFNKVMCAWFNGITRTKVDAVDCESIDGLKCVTSKLANRCEADGAKEKWLKAPKHTEPVIQVKQRRL